GGDGVVAFRSDSLTGDYEDIGVVFRAENGKQYWAPSVIYTQGKYYMYVSFMQKEDDDVHLQTMHVASSDFPYGPFKDEGKLIEPFSIDSHVVENSSGLYIFYSSNDYDADRAGTYILVDKMLSPTEVSSHPVSVVRPTIDEEIFARDRFRKGQHWHTLEGAFYLFKKGWHYVIYSGNCYESPYYYLGYASAKSDETDLTKIEFRKWPDEHTYRPLISKNDFEEGTGHNSVIYYQGEYYCVYHGRDLVPDGRIRGDSRTARICRLKIKDGVITAERYPDRL
ncbi:MAG: family 43 glycosylhydrolase, partial [Clostridia bacterium]|nr:family 43 glycosylhydrolase [Clostridia bacterium]